MADGVENLMLEHLKCFQATLERIDRRLGELTTRQNDTHAAVLGLRRDQVNDAEMSAHLQVQLDGVRGSVGADRASSRMEKLRIVE